MDDNPILEHINAPFHRGALELATHTQQLRNPTCGDEVRLQLILAGGHVKEAWFTAAGCMVSQAAASILCAHVDGKALTELAEFTPSDMLALISVPLTPHRQQCALLPFFALRTIIEDL